MSLTSERTGGTMSIHRSFLVRLYPVGDLHTGQISGLIEHVVSGEAKEFHCVADLLASIGLLLSRDSAATAIE